MRQPCTRRIAPNALTVLDRPVILAAMVSVVEPYVKTRRWRRVEYERLVDLGIFVGGALEVHRGPHAAADAAYGWVYRSVDILRPPATLTPLGAPGARIAVADLLP